MDASARRSSSRIPSLVALTVLASISFIAFTSVTSENRSFIRHEKRSVEITGDDSPLLSPNISNSTVLSVASSSISSSRTLSSSFSSLLSSSSSTTSLLLSSASSSSSHTFSVPSSTTPTPQSLSSTSTIVSTRPSSQSAQSSSSESRTTISPLQLITKVSTSGGITTSSDPLNGIPSTTLTFLENFSPTPSSSVEVSASPTSSPSVSAVANLSTSFWQKKGAVAATFVIVSLVIVAVVTVLIFFLVRRRNVRRQELLNDDIYEKFSAQDYRTSSPSPSIGAPPLDPFASTEIVYDTRTQPFQSYTPPSQTQHHLISVASYPVQHPDYYTSQPTAQHVIPSRSDSKPREVGTTPALRTPGARGSYQPSLDSFYGVAGQS